jgi:hypothetical protein
MKRDVNTARLTKAFIESRISQEEIVSKYLNIPIETVQDCIEHSHLIKSVFRDDDTDGSMGITYNRKGRLKVRDFGGFGFFEDVYGVVAYILSMAYERPISTNNKQDFYFVLKHIYRTFADEIDNHEHDYAVDDEIKNALVKTRNHKAIIELVPRSWNKEDKAIWDKYNVSLAYLNTHFVIPVDQYYINRTSNPDPKYRYGIKDPCYAYMLGQNRQGIYLIKLYFPLRNRHIDLKFITNCNVLEGLPNLERDNYDYIVITKSSKDRLSIGSHLVAKPLYGAARTAINIGVINLPSENYRLKANEYEWIKKKLSDDGMIISFLDFDRTGREGAKYLLDTYDIPYVFITRGEFGLVDYGCKDFADLHDKYTNDEIDQFIKETISYVEIRYRKNKNNTDAYFRRLSDCDLPY